MLGNPSSLWYARERKKDLPSHMKNQNILWLLSILLPHDNVFPEQTEFQTNSSQSFNTNLKQGQLVSYNVLSTNFSKSAWERLFLIFKLLYACSCSIHSFKKMLQDFH